MRVFRDIEQGSDEWLSLRMGKITGTRLKSVLMKKDDPVLIYEILSEMFNPVIEDGYVSADMQRGKDLEPIARAAYEEYSGHRIEQVGFVLHDKYEYSGYSPDGLIKIVRDYKKSIEMKCPATKTHIKYIVDGGIPKEYDSQILSAFFNAETISDVVFISFDDRLAQRPLHIVEVRREQYEGQIKELDEKLPAFWEKVTDYYNKVVF